MDPRRTTNRKMFWRILRRLLTANPGRLFVILLALGSGAAITAALLNLQIDASRRISREFRAFGPNAIVSPHASSGGAIGLETMDESILAFFKSNQFDKNFTGFSMLFSVATVKSGNSLSSTRAIVAGTDLGAFSLSDLSWTLDDLIALHLVKGDCLIGTRLASNLQLAIGSTVQLNDGNRSETCAVRKIITTGGPEDDQAILFLDQAQRLADVTGRITIVKVLIWGNPLEINRTVAFLQSRFPDLDVRPIRQFTEAQAKIYSRISGLLNFTVALVLVLTGLCVMAAMTNVAMERRTDVGLMKAIGGSVRRVLRFFLAEAALLGLAGGVLGATAGILLSIGLGKAVFGVPARPRLIVYPVAVALTILVAIVSSFPLRRLASIRPASVFRGEA